MKMTVEMKAVSAYYTREKVPMKLCMSFWGFSANRCVSTSNNSYKKL